jgi:mycothiol synthase
MPGSAAKNEPSAMGIRPLKKPDMRALLKLWAGSSLFDPMDKRLLNEKIFGDPEYDPSLTLVSASGQELQGFAMAVKRCRSSSVTGYIKLIAVHPEWQRKGIGTRLLDLLEARLADDGVREARVGESAPNYLVPGVDLRHRPATHFFAHRGYREIGRTCNLEVNLDLGDFQTTRAERKLEARQISIRRATKDDLETINAFLAVHWPSWQSEVSTALKQHPSGVHLAQSDAGLLGFAARDGNNLGTGWFGPMGTHPEARGLGIGQVLLRRCMADLKSQGLKSATIPWVGPAEFYQQHVGALPSREFLRLEKRLPADRGRMLL